MLLVGFFWELFCVSGVVSFGCCLGSCCVVWVCVGFGVVIGIGYSGIFVGVG